MRTAQSYLEIVHHRGERGLDLKRVYANILNRDLFLMAYGKLYANAGAMTAGVNPDDTVQGMSLERIDKIINQLRNRTYHWQPTRRKGIPKKGGQVRALGLPIYRSYCTSY